jgi:ribosomal protein S18 acetylase RimI-like enzyme
MDPRADADAGRFPTVEVRSLGYRTDLMVRLLAGSEVTDQGQVIVVRTPENPGFHWGNFLLWPGPPAEAAFDEWIATFAREFPDAHMTLGIDGTEIPSGIEGSVPNGLVVELSLVLTTRRPPEANEVIGTPIVRPLRSDNDWYEEHLLRIALDEEGQPLSSAQLEFLQRSTGEARRMVEAGQAEYFGAFSDDRLCSVVGIASDGRGVARYQNVGTRPEFRRRGFASLLLARAGAFGVDEFGARLLVIVADHDGSAADLYRAVGFAPVEQQWGLSAPSAP